MSNQFPLPVVAGIGSCRITTPLTILQRKKKIVAKHNKIDWYTHSSRDAIQKMAIVSNQKQLSEEQIPLVVHGRHKWHPENHSHDLLLDVDCFVVEIASLKLIDYGGLELQQWCMRDLLLQEGVPVPAFTKALSEPIGHRDLSFLSDSVSQQIRDIGTWAVATKQDSSALLNDLIIMESEIRRPLVLVPHINVEGSSGTLIEERVIISETLRRFCDSRGHVFFDPAVHVRAFGVLEALKDLGHYTPEFEHIIAEHLNEAIGFALNPQTQKVQT